MYNVLQTVTFNLQADIISCVSVFRCLPKTDFSAVWPNLVGAIKENGFLSCDFFGTEHKWYKGNEDQTYLTIEQIHALLNASSLIIVDETEYKEQAGMVLTTPVYFHYFEIVAQKVSNSKEQQVEEIDQETTAKIIGI